MSESTFDTAITRMYGTRVPIVAGGLMWLATADYVAACARAGIIGFITAATFPSDEDLRREIDKCRDLADGKPFGVNISMLPNRVPEERTEDVIRLVAKSGVRFVETSGRSPEAFLPVLHDAGIRVLHKVPSLRFAAKAEAVGVDAVSIVGAECGGHPGMDMIGSLVNAGLAKERISIPWLLGGGIGCGSQVVSALAMGASGVVVGTRFLSAMEIPAHEDYKRALVAAKESETALTLQSVRNTVRSLKNETTEVVQQLERDNPRIGIGGLMAYVAGSIGKNAYDTGDISRGILSAGQALGFVDRVEPIAEIVKRLEDQMTAALNTLQSITPSPDTAQNPIELRG